MSLVRTFLFVILGALASFDASAYEITFSADTPPGGAPATFFYPINARKWGVDMYGVRCAILWGDALNPSKFHSAMPKKPNDGGSVLPDGTVKLSLGIPAPVVGTFKDGRLIAFEKEGDDVDKEKHSKFLSARLPRKKAMEAFRWQPDHSHDGKRYWQDSGRLRLWYANPNAAGTLFAELGLLALAIVLSVRRVFVRVLGGVFCVAMLVGLWETGSRGSLLGFAVAAAVVCAAVAVHRGRKRLVLVVSGLLLVGILAVSLVFLCGKANIQLDGSSAERLKIWRDAPQMMAAAPGGWQTSSGYAWCEWFEPQDDYFVTVWMVNSHISQLVLHGTVFRLLYIFAWTFLLSALGLFAFRTGKTAAIAQWVGFAIAQWFSTVGFLLSLWIAPVVSLLTLAPFAAKSIGSGEWRAVLRTAAKVAIASAVFSGAVLWGILKTGEILEQKETHPGLVKRMPGGVQIGYGEPQVFLVHDKRTLTGGSNGILGKDLRAYYHSHTNIPAMFIADSLEDLPSKVDTLVLAGEAADAYISKCRDRKPGAQSPVSAKQIVLISPETDWKDISKGLFGDSDVRYVMGELALMALKSSKRARPSWVESVPCAAVYPPDWKDRVFFGKIPKQLQQNKE